MIEFRIYKTGEWVESNSKAINSDNIDFACTDLRIDGIVYEKNSSDLIVALRDALFWMKLQK